MSSSPHAISRFLSLQGVIVSSPAPTFIPGPISSPVLGPGLVQLPTNDPTSTPSETPVKTDLPTVNFPTPVPSPSPSERTNIPTITSVPTFLPTITEQPSYEQTMFLLGTVTYITNASTYDPQLLQEILQANVNQQFMDNGIEIEAAVELLSTSKLAGLETETTTQVTTYGITAFISTSFLLSISVGIDFNTFIRDYAKGLSEYFGIFATDFDLTVALFATLSERQGKDTFLQAIDAIPTTATPSIAPVVLSAAPTT